MASRTMLMMDSHNYPVQLMPVSAPQTIVVKGIGDVATANLSAAITKNAIRVTSTVDTWLTFTVTDLVTAATGHFLLASSVYDFPMPLGQTKISVVAVGATAGTLYLSELG